MRIIFREKNPRLFLKNWQNYLKKNIASYRYLPDFLDSMLYYSKTLIDDKSFLLIQNNRVVSICFLPIEKNKSSRIMTLTDGYIPAPLAINEKVEKYTHKQIEEIAKKAKVKLIKFYLDPLIIEYKDKFNNLLKYGFIDSSSVDCLLDLGQSKKKLWLNIRKGHRGDIKKILKNKDFKLITIDKTKADYDAHEQYRKLHHKCSGRVTRNKKTFDLQFEMLKKGNALMVGLEYKDKFVGFNYFFHYQKTAIYASGVDDPNYNKFPLYHSILWTAMNYYKKRGFNYLQLSRPCGYNEVSGYEDYLDKKQINIGFFKRGFGGKIVPFFRGVKYFDKKEFEKSIKEFKSRVLEII